MHSKLVLSLAVASLIAVGCSSGGSTEADPAPDSTDTVTSSDVAVSSDAAASSDTPGVRLVSVVEGAEIQANPPADLVILDVRTPEEFAEGHLDGAIMIDFYGDDFADQLAGLDPNAPYLLYCRSGSRSGQTATMMRELGFTDVADIDGGIGAWTGADLPLTTSSVGVGTP